jgi:hypothetical protein
MPRTDGDQWKLIEDTVGDRAALSVPISKLAIINYNAPPEYFRDITSLFRPQSVRTFNDGFAEFSVRG